MAILLSHHKFAILIVLLSFFTTLSHQATTPPNPRLLNAFYALQAWKHSITSDPRGFTSDWYGYNVCNYTGVFCAPSQDDPHLTTVAGVDLNHANISGSLPEDLGLLTDLALFHINTNRFCGTVPKSFKKLSLLYELDISNNRFSGDFPSVVLSLPSLKFLDIRFNQFKGEVPSDLYNLKLDAIFINNNLFETSFPKNLGNSPVSVIVFANNAIKGCLPSSIKKMSETLEELMLVNVSLSGCLTPDIGSLRKLRVLDVSQNSLVGMLPESIGNMKSLEQLNVAHNKFSGDIPTSICSLPRLENFTYSDNYFFGEPKICLKLADKDDRKNCIPNRPLQRKVEECKAFYNRPVNCRGCGAPPPPPPPPPTKHWLPPYDHHTYTPPLKN
ncbi:putative leucine-rich repeat-containing, plant-type, leucine-rich repeat domain superfamily [Helianthus annuus]|uniref:Cell wall hydroxyproline-rich glycoprotein n=1 Tax=Helianthus annuus TaxID=4232 RepID=A0A251UEM3_HELAN|nr:leucine-rich repeat extensin-like protein 6 [Helianthus annuus]KAF5800016.1 putative leucine-rich repeat-containing, plant-type, leucine-rich repeat domain superfamily [Helianthus annuus]KAJ0551390.1 putative leucine-rich repeat-containing, plant-type, leucine-rich repeat domain superfamily [Helianthus annuus]KAJ0558423.1 putative leucine-rich repeat-containing, plant-type, leucine-rich repeat domain superfamily [Helianthus annuus]KAJ0564355.1 putative leucine-rich repeat-containing, plant-t